MSLSLPSLDPPLQSSKEEQDVNCPCAGRALAGFNLLPKDEQTDKQRYKEKCTSHENWHLLNYNFNVNVVIVSFNTACDWCRIHMFLKS